MLHNVQHFILFCLTKEYNRPCKLTNIIRSVTDWHYEEIKNPFLSWTIAIQTLTISLQSMTIHIEPKEQKNLQVRGNGLPLKVVDFLRKLWKVQKIWFHDVLLYFVWPQQILIRLNREFIVPQTSCQRKNTIKRSFLINFNFIFN